MAKIDLNSDIGESFGAYTMGLDAEILKIVDSANIACGFHAGDPIVMQKTVKEALKNNVKVGAHPGFPDLVGFGRRNMAASAEEIYAMTLYQIGALDAFVRAQGAKLNHVKPHGALYNIAASDEKLASAICRAVYDLNPTLILYALSGSKMIAEAEKLGLKTASEVFADRTYQKDGSLTPRRMPGAMIVDEEESIKQVLQMIKEGTVKTLQGDIVPIKVDTICVHGDGIKAVEFAKRIKENL
ncbi:MAG: LamB/YcsF family protein [Elusimicrobiota bacterium]|jgi:UPF0271 protein|nr:LamB/YcsF family protein [Elusimicrobiota bacterium]